MMQPENRIQRRSVRVDHRSIQRLSRLCPLAADIHVNPIVRDAFHRILSEDLSRVIKSRRGTTQPQVARRSVRIRRKEGLGKTSRKIHILVWNRSRVSQSDLRCPQDIYSLDYEQGILRTVR